MKYLLVLASVALVCATDDEAAASSRAGGFDRSFPDLLRRNEVAVATLRDVYSSLANYVKSQGEEDDGQKNFAFVALFYDYFLRDLRLPSYEAKYELNLKKAKAGELRFAHLNAANALLFLDKLRVHTRKRSAALQRLCYHTTSNQECEDSLKAFDDEEEGKCHEHKDHVTLHKFLLENVYKFEAFVDDALNAKKEKFENLTNYLKDLRDRPTQKLVLDTLLPKLYQLLLLDPLDCPYGHYLKQFVP